MGKKIKDVFNSIKLFKRPGWDNFCKSLNNFSIENLRGTAMPLQTKLFRNKDITFSKRTDRCTKAKDILEKGKGNGNGKEIFLTKLPSQFPSKHCYRVELNHDFVIRAKKRNNNIRNLNFIPGNIYANDNDANPWTQVGYMPFTLEDL